jgi:deoxycytidine triphosphate deaminase
MPLSDREIWAELESGRLVVTPELAIEQVGPGSIDLRLDKLAKKFKQPPPGYDQIRLSAVSAKALID